jgi:hypothetical protein
MPAHICFGLKMAVQQMEKGTLSLSHYFLGGVKDCEIVSFRFLAGYSEWRE